MSDPDLVGARDHPRAPTLTPGRPLPPDRPDWAVQAADAIEQGVGTIRDKTAVPLDRVARILVYGVVASLLGIASLVLLAIAIVRALDVALPADVWAAHLTTGGIFTLAGLFLWSRRRRSSAT